MDRKKEKIIEYTIIVGISAALFAAIIAFKDAHAELPVSEGLRALENVAGFGTDAAPAPAPSNEDCHVSETCGVHFLGGIRG